MNRIEVHIWAYGPARTGHQLWIQYPNGPDPFYRHCLHFGSQTELDDAVERFKSILQRRTWGFVAEETLMTMLMEYTL